MIFPNLALLRQLAGAVKERNWHVGRNADYHWAGQISVESHSEHLGTVAKVLFSGNANFPEEAIANAAYVAEANPTNILALLDYIDALEARVSALTLENMAHERNIPPAEPVDTVEPAAAELGICWQLAPHRPTAEMIDAGAQRLVRGEDGVEWPASWSRAQVAQARREAENVWLSMWSAVESPLVLPGAQATAWSTEDTKFLVDTLTDAVTASIDQRSALGPAIQAVIEPLVAQLRTPAPVAVTPTLDAIALAVQRAMDAAANESPVKGPYPPADINLAEIITRVVNEGPYVRLPIATSGYVMLPVRETEEMHDAVMSLLYKGVGRSDTNQFLAAYIQGASLSEFKAQVQAHTPKKDPSP